MGKLVEFGAKEIEEVSTEYDNLEIPKSDEYINMAFEVGNFIRVLPLTNAQNDQLIDLIVRHMEIGRTDAFLFGMDLGIKIGESAELKGDK